MYSVKLVARHLRFQESHFSKILKTKFNNFDMLNLWKPFLWKFSTPANEKIFYFENIFNIYFLLVNKNLKGKFKIK